MSGPEVLVSPLGLDQDTLDSFATTPPDAGRQLEGADRRQLEIEELPEHLDVPRLQIHRERDLVEGEDVVHLGRA